MSLIKSACIHGCTRQGLAALVAWCFLSQQLVQGGQVNAVTLPTSGAYVAGSGSIKASGNAVTINQSTLRGIIDWSTFSIGQSGTVTFKNGNGATLNRVTGNQMSSILGSLFSSGSVYLINPEGVLVGGGAHINTGGDFVASTLDLSNQLFMGGGPLLFHGDSQNVVVNLGDIFSDKGSVFLVGHTVTNSGSLRAGNGSVGLGAGSEVLLKDSTSDQRVFVQGLGGDVTNTGTIAAAQAELRAKGGNVYALAGDNGGAIAARGTAKVNGHVWLISDGGTTQVTGSISAQNANGAGGDIETSGHDLDISHATVKTGQGGNWLLDPVDLLIDSAAASTIQTSLATTNVTVQTTATSASGPGTQSAGNGDITVASNIGWSSGNLLTLSAYRDIHLNAGISITNTGAGSVMLRADNTSNGTGTVSFDSNAKLDWSQSTGIASVLYNPTDSEERFDNPTDFSPYFVFNNTWSAPNNHSVSNQLTAYMLVNNAYDLGHLQNSGDYALGTDLDVSANGSFTAQGQGVGFSGIFDGFQHTIHGLTIHTNDASLGLFETLNQGSIVRNLNLTAASVIEDAGDPGGEVGVLVGHNDGTVANVTAAGTVKNANSPTFTGGIVGNNTVNGAIYNSTSSVTVDESSSGNPGSPSAIGGLAGQSGGIISGSSASGAVIGNQMTSTGGLVGGNTGTISNSSASGAVSDPGEITQIGGLIGTNTGTLSGVSASGSVSGTGNTGVMAGGLIGWNNVALSNFSATGAVTAGDHSQAGGLVGHQEGAGITNANASGNVIVGDNAYAGGLVGRTSTAVTNSTASGAVVGGTNGYYGGLIGYTNAAVSGASATGAVTSNGGNAITANFVGGLVGRADTGSSVSGSNATGVVTTGGYGSIGGLIGASAVAVTSSYATGNVNGGTQVWAGGLVGEADSTVDGSHATGNVQTTSDASAGGLIGHAQGAVTNSNATGMVSGQNASWLGGLIGYSNSSVSGSTSTGNVVGTTYAEAGGLIGHDEGAVTNSNATGSVSGQNASWLGGLIGYTNSSVSGSTSAGSVVGTTYAEAGGLIGHDEGAVTNSNATGAVSAQNASWLGGLIGYTNSAVSDSTSTGNVVGTTYAEAGGLIGHDEGSVTNSHATGAVGAQNASWLGGLIGYTNSSVSGSTSTGNVVGTTYAEAGGLIGNADTGGSISGSNASGAVTTGDNGSLGGLVGRSLVAITSSNATGSVVGANFAQAGSLIGHTEGAVTSSTATGSVTAGANSYAGGLLGYATVAVSGLSATANVQSGSSSYAGGLIGYTTANVTGASASGTVNTGSGSPAGGLIGFSLASVFNSTASGNVTGGSGGAIGGLIGQTSQTVSNSSASGTVTGGIGSAAGGLAGAAVSITASTATGAVSGGFAVGGLSGISNSVDGSSASGAVSSTFQGAMAGGLVGFIPAGSVSNSHASGNVTVADGNAGSCEGPCNGAGGLVGIIGSGPNSPSISNSYATGNVVAGAYYTAGGLVGQSEVPVQQSYATGSVQSGFDGGSGGLIGAAFAPVFNSHATGNVTVGAGDTDGFGYAVGGGLIGFANDTVTSSYASGTVTGGNFSAVGGLVGYANVSVSASYASGAVSAGAGGWAGGLVGISYATIDSSYATGNVTVGSGVNPTDPTDTPGAYAGGLVGYALEDGTITNAYATGNVAGGDQTYVGGLAGWSHPNVAGSYATGTVSAGNSADAGGLVGGNDNAISHSYASGTVVAGDNSYVGGLSGDNNGSVDTSYATGNVSGGTSPTANAGCGGCTSVGGLVGWSPGTVTTSMATGNVLGQGVAAWVGGLAGGTAGNLSQSYSTGAVTATGAGAIAGGLIGEVGAAVADSYATGAVNASGNGSIAAGLAGVLNASTVDTSYSTGLVSGADTLGGLIGQNLASGVVTSSHWDTTTSGQATSAGGTGLTTVQWLTQGPAATSDAAWNFSDVWALGYPYPVLKAFPYVVATLTPSGTRVYGGAAPSVALTSAVDRSNNNAIGSITGALTPVIPDPAIGSYNLGGSGQSVPNSQLTYLGSVTITPALLTLTGLTSTKIYDGTTNAPLSLASLGLSGLVGADAVTIIDSAATGLFADKNAGTNKPVTISGISIGGLNAANYIFVIPPTTGTISPLTLTVGGTTIAANKIYDGNTSAVISGTSISGVLEGDSLSFAQSGLFSDKNVGTGKTVTYTNSLSGADAGNYILASAGGTLAANITPATLVVGGTTVAANKVYDGNRTASVTGGSISGLIGDDTVTLAQSGQFSDKNAANGKTVTYANSLTGADAGNYVLSTDSGTLIANITPAPLFYLANSTATNTYRPFGVLNPEFTGTVTGLVGGDTLASVASGVPVFSSNTTNSSAAGVYPVIGGGLTLTSSNYTLSQASTNAFTIQPITITIGNFSKLSGSPNPSFTVNYSGPTSSYLQSVLDGLTLVTNAPTGDIPGIYQITAAIPAELASSILVQPGTLTINANSNVLLNNGSRQAVSTIPASFNSQQSPPPRPLPGLSDGSPASSDPLLPGNAVSQFQVVIMPSQTWPAQASQTPASGNGGNLSSASFTETSPDGRTQNNKSTYAAGAHQ